MNLDPDILRRWLAAEARARDEEQGAEKAEEALLQLFRSVPRPAPPAGFAERVLARAGVTVAAADTALSRPAGRIWGWAVAVCVALVGVSSLFWLPVAWELLREVGWWAPVELAGESVRALGDALRRGFVFWELLSRMSVALGRAVARPSVAMSLAGAVLVAVLAFRWLLDLTTASARERSWSHA